MKEFVPFSICFGIFYNIIVMQYRFEAAVEHEVESKLDDLAASRGA